MYFKTSRDGFHSELQSCESVSRVVTYLSIRGGLRVSPPYGSCNILGLFFSLSTPSPNLFFPTLEFQAHNWMWRMWKIAFDFSSSLSFFFPLSLLCPCVSYKGKLAGGSTSLPSTGIAFKLAGWLDRARRRQDRWLEEGWDLIRARIDGWRNLFWGTSPR